MKPWLLFLFFLAHLASSTAQNKMPAQAIDSYIQESMKAWKIPGCAIAIVDAKGIQYLKGYGSRDLENQLPVTGHTLFKIASCTKSFTATAAARLVDQQLLSWDQPVATYLPQLRFIDPMLTQQVSLRDLLAHRTGLYDDDWSWVGDHVDENRMFEILAAMPVKGNFRSSYIYSNMGYALAGKLMSHAAKRSWREQVSYFFSALGMKNSTFSHTDAPALADFAFGYTPDSAGKFIRGNLNEHFTDSASKSEPFGFISSSAHDISRWLGLFIHGGKWQGQQLIPAAVFGELIKPLNYMEKSRDKEISDSYYCMGWVQNFYKNHRLLQHSGGLAGFKCYMSFMPEDSLGIVVLSNGDAHAFPQAASYDLYDLVLSLDRTSWTNRYLERLKKRAAMPAPGAMNIPGTSPSKPLVEFAGVYYNKWLGEIKLIYEDGSLWFQFHRYPKERLKHAHYNTFYTEAQRTPGAGISFQLDHDGKVCGMKLNEYDFVKNPDKARQ
jgi:CubicO group peptidase (beta-lactamase class C family)